MKKHNFHKTTGEMAKAILEAMRTANLGGFSDEIAAIRCASAAIEFIAKKRGYTAIGDNGDMLDFVLNNVDTVVTHCSLEPICKHFKKSK